jgi:hypothetical protein
VVCSCFNTKSGPSSLTFSLLDLSSFSKSASIPHPTRQHNRHHQCVHIKHTRPRQSHDHSGTTVPRVDLAFVSRLIPSRRLHPLELLSPFVIMSSHAPSAWFSCSSSSHASYPIAPIERRIISHAQLRQPEHKLVTYLTPTNTHHAQQYTVTCEQHNMRVYSLVGRC